MSQQTSQRTFSAERDAISLLRDWARKGGLDFRERDPAVMLLHRALDDRATLVRRLEAIRHWADSSLRVAVDGHPWQEGYVEARAQIRALLTPAEAK